MKLDERLLTITQYINKDILLDIGCDHGKLAVFALLNDIIKKAICVDISQDSLEKTRLLVKKYNLEDKVKCVCADGKDVEFCENQCVVIAGLGGNEICNIIDKKVLPQGSILIPHQDANIVRQYLSKNGQQTQFDFVLKSRKKYYDFIVIGDGDKYTDSSILLGKNTPKSQFYNERIKNRLEKIMIYQNKNCGLDLKIEKEIFEDALLKANC